MTLGKSRLEVFGLPSHVLHPLLEIFLDDIDATVDGHADPVRQDLDVQRMEPQVHMRKGGTNDRK